jgi:hypothetical protein
MIKLTKSEAGKLGAIASRVSSAKIKKDNEQRYLQNSKHCLHCNIVIPYDDRVKKFCNSSCSTTFNNLKRDKKKSNCLSCNTELIGRHRKYCNNKCQNEHNYRDKLINGTLGKSGLKRWLEEKYGYRCAECGLSEWCNKPIVLELEHRDGNSENNDFENLCLICPNCHSQTDTYKGKNKGNGRHARRQRYAEGKSF